MRSLLTLVIAVAICAWSGAATTSGRTLGRSAGGPELRQMVAAEPVESYSARRTLEATSRGGAMRATVVARTVFDADEGLTYEILEETGSGLIRGKVLRAALEAERDLWRSGEAERGALTPENYEFGDVVAQADGSRRVAIHARRQDKLLLNGAMFLAEPDGDLLRVEGVMVKRPSFWTRRVEVSRTYARVGGVRVPVRMESRANVRIGGRSTFTMTYDYESINGRDVKIPRPDSESFAVSSDARPFGGLKP